MSSIKHAEFCLPRPENTEPRLERYTHRHEDGTVTSVERCVECGEAHYLPLGNLTLASDPRPR